LRYQDEVLVYTQDPTTSLYTVPKYSPVVAFTGIFPDQTGPGVELTFEQANRSQTLTLSGGHMVYARLTRDAKPDFHEARRLTPSSYLLHGSADPIAVTGVRDVIEKGWFTPLTEEGTIVTNGVLASCHNGPSHAAARMFYRPLHGYLSLVPREKGLKPSANTHEHSYSIGFKRDSFIGNTLFSGLVYLALRDEKTK
jgi:hypothetical protein